MAPTLPLFPLNTVLFPGVVVPLHVFEERYRALVRHLLAEQEPARRLFGSVGIREGYEVGDHGAQSLYRVGCRLQLTDVAARADGSFDIQAVGRDRFRLDRLHTQGAFPAAEITPLAADDEQDAAPSSLVADAVREAVTQFEAYRAAVRGFREDPHPGPLPADPTYLSWVLAAAAPLTLPERQALLEGDLVVERLREVTRLLREELRAMQAIPSLPATEVARTRWSPN
ncbi:MAG: LON peptidase substrate-binding domain-containing protein [Nocardioides sp.]